MPTSIIGNMCDGILTIDEDLVTLGSPNFIFQNNYVKGDCTITKTLVNKDMLISECTFHDHIHECYNMDYRVWFIYHNFVVKQRCMDTVLGQYKRGVISRLDFSSDSDVISSILAQECLDFLEQHYNGRTIL